MLRTLILAHLDSLLPLVKDALPPEVQSAGGVLPLAQALKQMHRPESLAEALQGRNRLAFEELLHVQLMHRRANKLARESRAGCFQSSRCTCVA